MSTKRYALRQRRRFLGYTQADLARKIGVNRSTIARWERDGVDPHQRKRGRLAAVLGVRPADLDVLLADTTVPTSISPAESSADIIIESPVGQARLPTVHAITTALITDPTGKVLLVKPAAQKQWVLPGGIMAGSESPDAACSRILREDLGFMHHVGKLLVVDWTPSTGPHRAAMHLVFDGGTLPTGTTIHLTGDWADAAFIALQRIRADDLSPDDAARTQAAHSARRHKKTAYLSGTTDHRRQRP